MVVAGLQTPHLRRKNPELYAPVVEKRAGRTEVVKEVEVMAPAGGWPQLRAAVMNGADAVYFGLAEGYSARARAANFAVDELRDVVDFCHDHEVYAYVAVNTLVFDEELRTVEQLLRRCLEAQVDAVIVQDLAVQRMARDLGLVVHASTQQSISSAAGANYAAKHGASRVVVGRELSLDDIKDVVQHSQVDIEVFVHGALCVSWSGQCLSSEAWGGRSANRGQCAQGCRMPYDLIVDGHKDDAAGYLLSPQDLCGVEDVPQLIDAGVKCLKIEGRLKDERYVAATTRAYRDAVDGYQSVSRQDLAQIFSRGQDPKYDGLSSGFLHGANHQTLVRGRSPRHRGIFMGHVRKVSLEGDLLWLDVDAEDLKIGDGIVFMEPKKPAAFQNDDLGGNIVKQRGQRFALRRKSVIPAVGDEVWRTADAAVDGKFRSLAKLGPRQMVKRSIVDVGLKQGELELRDDHFTVTKPLSTEGASSKEALVKAIGVFGDAPWGLGTIDIAPGVTARAADVKRARRDAVLDLKALRAERRRHHHKGRTTLSSSSEEPSKRRRNVEETSRGVSLLVRSQAQCEAAIQMARRYPDIIDEVVIDFLEITGIAGAVTAVQEANVTAIVASPRIIMPNEDRVLQALVDSGADAILARSPLENLNISSIRGDFSFNAANTPAVRDLLETMDRVTPAYDLGGRAIGDLARNLDDPGRLEAVLHCHLPIFHTSHCVFARHLSNGTDYRSCGHPCERHTIALRDATADHVVLADMGCRNTVFNGVAQSGARHLPEWLDSGIRRFRLEFLDESATALKTIVDAYVNLLNNNGRGPEPLWSLLTHLPSGVDVGSFRDAVERPSGLKRC